MQALHMTHGCYYGPLTSPLPTLAPTRRWKAACSGASSAAVSHACTSASSGRGCRDSGREGLQAQRQKGVGSGPGTTALHRCTAPALAGLPRPARPPRTWVACCSATPSTTRCARTYASAAASRPPASARRTALAFLSVAMTCRGRCMFGRAQEDGLAGQAARHVCTPVPAALAPAAPRAPNRHTTPARQPEQKAGEGRRSGPAGPHLAVQCVEHQRHAHEKVGRVGGQIVAEPAGGAGRGGAC